MSLEGSDASPDCPLLGRRIEAFARQFGQLPLAVGFGIAALAAGSAPWPASVHADVFFLIVALFTPLGMVPSPEDGGLNQRGADHASKLIPGISSIESTCFMPW